MAKKKDNKWALAIGIAILIVLFYPQLSTFFSAFGGIDDFYILDDFEGTEYIGESSTFTCETYQSGTQTCVYGRSNYESENARYTFDSRANNDVNAANAQGSVSFEQGRMILYGQGTLDINQDFKAQDVKIALSSQPVKSSSVSNSWVCVTAAHSVNINGYSYQAFPGEVQRTNCGSEKASGLIEIISSKLDPDQASIYINGEFVETINIGTSMDISINMGNMRNMVGDNAAPLYIDSIKFKHPFNCKIETNQELVYERFYEGMTLTKESTSLPVDSFCLEHPAIVIDSTLHGSQSNPEIYYVLASGGELTVPDNQEYLLFYVADLGGDADCLDGEVYDPLTRKCYEIGSALQEPTEPVVLTHDQSTSFNLMPGSSFDAGTLTYNCGVPDQTMISPGSRYVDDSCWAATYSFAGQSGTLHHNEQIVLNDYFYLTLKSAGRYSFESGAGEWTNAGWQNTWILSPTGEDIIRISFADEKATVSDKVSIKVTNNLADADAGIVMKYDYGLIQTEEGQSTYDFVAKKGTDTYDVLLDLELEGDVLIEFQPYAVVGDVQYPSDFIRRTYYISSSDNEANVTNNEETTETNEEEETTENQEDKTETDDESFFSKYKWGIIGVIILIIFFGMGNVKWPKRKKR